MDSGTKNSTNPNDFHQPPPYTPGKCKYFIFQKTYTFYMTLKLQDNLLVDILTPNNNNQLQVNLEDILIPHSNNQLQDILHSTNLHPQLFTSINHLIGQMFWPLISDCQWLDDVDIAK